MSSYSREIIGELVAGTLPWHQTKRIMSAYKDEDRFFKVLSVLQDRVSWDDRILLPIGDHLFIAETPVDTPGDEARNVMVLRTLAAG